jgi:hypothetical protein
MTFHSSRHDREAGAAMMVAVMVLTVVAVLSMAIATLAMRSTRAAGDAQTAGVVKDLANAGLAEGVTYLRQVGATPAIDGQTPVPDGAGACGTPTVNPAAPTWTKGGAALVRSGTQGEYAVWIEEVDASSGAYRVCAEGRSGQGKRTTSVRAIYTPAGGSAGPYAVYGGGDINLQSAAQSVENMSVYSEDCIDRKHNKETVEGATDLASGRPPAAHSLLWVLPKGSCQAEDSIHDGPDHVDDMFPYDTDKAGGPIAGDPNAAGKPALSAAPWNGSTLETATDAATFRARWGVPDMLGTTSIAALEQTAKQQGNYHYLTSSTLPSVKPDEAHAVVFLDFKKHESVNLKSVPFLDPFTTSSCLTGKSLILVVRNADVTANGNGALRATVVIKNGGVTKMNGTFDLIGGLFADGELDLSGTGTIKLDDCAVKNPPPGGTPQVDVSNYMEYDRS